MKILVIRSGSLLGEYGYYLLLQKGTSIKFAYKGCYTWEVRPPREDQLWHTEEIAKSYLNPFIKKLSPEDFAEYIANKLLE